MSTRSYAVPSLAVALALVSCSREPDDGQRVQSHSKFVSIRVAGFVEAAGIT